MVNGTILLILRVGLIAAVSSAIWLYVKPTTKIMRVVRAALLVVALLLTLAVVKAVSA